MKGEKKTVEASALVAKYLRAGSQLIEQGAGSRDVAAFFRLVADLVQKTPPKELVRLAHETRTGESKESRSELIDLPLEQLEKRINSDGVTRRELEAVAIERFSVPKGSMRSFATISVLREKLNLLIENAKTHAAISDIASQDQGR